MAIDKAGDLILLNALKTNVEAVAAKLSDVKTSLRAIFGDIAVETGTAYFRGYIDLNSVYSDLDPTDLDTTGLDTVITDIDENG